MYKNNRLEMVVTANPKYPVILKGITIVTKTLHIRVGARLEAELSFVILRPVRESCEILTEAYLGRGGGIDQIRKVAGCPKIFHRNARAYIGSSWARAA